MKYKVTVIKTNTCEAIFDAENEEHLKEIVETAVKNNVLKFDEEKINIKCQDGN